jgi:hypothetical protein
VPDLVIQSGIETLLATANIEFTPGFLFSNGNFGKVAQGEGFLFKVRSGPYDTIAIVNVAQEKVRFENVILDNYVVLVRTEPDYSVSNGLESVSFIPTYFVSTFDFQQADLLLLRTDVNDTLFMQRSPRELTSIDGDGFVDLTVESDLRRDGETSRLENRRRVRKAGCSLSRRTIGGGRTENEEWVLIAYKETDDNGEVNFGFLPAGFYRLNIQYPGIPMDLNSFIQFEISNEQEKQGYVLAALITDEAIVVELVQRLGFYRKYFKDLNVYPIPAHDRVTIEYSRLNSSLVKVRLIDMQGKTLMEQKLDKGQNQRIQLEVEHLHPGIYILDFYDETSPKREISRYKLIIRH